MEISLLMPSAGLLNLLRDVVCVVGADGRFVFVSAACEQVFGYTPQEMVGTAMIDMVVPEDRARTLAQVGAVISGATGPHFENRYLRKDGRHVHIMWSAHWSASDQVRIAVARDVTERKRAESMQAAMHAISEAAHAAKDLPALFPLIHRIVNALLPAPGFSIALHDTADDQIRFPYHVDEHGQSATRSMPAAATLVRHVMRSGPLLLTPANRGQLTASLRAAAAHAAPYWLGVPLTSQKGPIGALVVTGAPDRVCDTLQDQELLQFVSAQVATAIERAQLYEQLRYMAQHDTLTGLPNRQLLHARLAAALAPGGSDPAGFSLLYLDLDGFKQVNDRFGHAAGDLLLQEVARRMRRCVRETDTVARIGGDEFVVLLEGLRLHEDAARVAAEIRDIVRQPVNIGGHIVHSTSSVGIATYPQHGDSAPALLKHADEAMYRAKQRRHAAAALSARSSV